MKNSIAFALSLLLCAPACGRDDDDGGGGGGGGGGADGGAGDDTTIFQVQSDDMPVGTAVTVRGVVVTAIDTYGSRKGGIYVQEPEGGAFSGVFVYLRGTEAADLEVGDLVDLEGFVKDEFAWQGGCDSGEDEGSLTELSPAEGVTPTVTKVGDGTVPAPEVLQPWELAASLEESEKWEGVLVTFENVRVLNPPSGDTDDQRTMRVTGPYVVQSSLTDLPDTIAEGDCYASITGIGDFFFDYKILPRSAADLVAGGDCLPVEDADDLCGDGVDNDYSGHGDCADFSCQAAVVECTADTQVSAIQGGAVAENSRVRLADVVVTGRSYNGKRFWVQEQGDQTEPGTGIYVYRPGSAEVLPDAVQVGATLTLEANVDEYYSGCSGNAFTQLTFAEIVDGPTGSGPGPEPLTGVSLATLASDTEGEPYEGVLVTIEDVEVTEVHDGLPVNLEFTVSDGSGTLVVDDDIYRYTEVAVGQCLTITGIMHYNTFDNSADGGLPPHITIEPRSAGEIVTSNGCP
ncbi:MAG TPA: hypothetical protein VKZ63_19805 [Kofleriaceae bacterium]|nr:hypothetical protein [Kofleriaceae bacterium]